MNSTSFTIYQCCDNDRVYLFKRKEDKIYMKTYDIYMKFLRKTNISCELQKTLFTPLKDSQEKKWGTFTLEGQLCIPCLETIQRWICLVKQGQFSAPVEKITISDHPEWPLRHVRQLSSGHLIAGTWMNVVISDPKRDFENVQTFNKNINYQGNYDDCCELSNGDLITVFNGSKQTDKEGKVIQNTPSSLDLWRRNGTLFQHNRVILEDDRNLPGNLKAHISSVVQLKDGLIAAAVESDIKFWVPRLDYKCLKTLSQHESNRIHCMIYADGFIISASDKFLKIYNTDDYNRDSAETFYITDDSYSYQSCFLRSGRISCLLKLSDGRLLLGAEDGLMVEEKSNSDRHFKKIEGTPRNISQMIELSSGIIACVVRGWIYLLDPSKQFLVKTSYQAPLHLPLDSDSVKNVFHGESILELEDGKWMWGHSAKRIYLLSPVNQSENPFPIDDLSQKKLLEIAPKITPVAERILLYQRIIASNPYCFEAHEGLVKINYSWSNELKVHFLLRSAAIFLGKDQAAAEGFIRQASLLAKKSTSLGIQRRLLDFLSYVRQKEAPANL